MTFTVTQTRSNYGANVLAAFAKYVPGATKKLVHCGFEAAKLPLKGAKELAGVPYTEEINGKMVSCPREALYHKNLFAEKQVNALKDYCATKKLFNKIPLKSAPSIIKGLFFVGASISGYALGTKGMELLIGKEKDNSTNTVQLNSNYSGAVAA